MSKKIVISNIEKRKITALLAVCITTGITSYPLLNNTAIAQNNTQIVASSEAIQPNTNKVKSFVYNWFFLLDSQVAVTPVLEQLSSDNLLMEFPEMTINNHDDFKQWYAGVQQTVESNTHDLQQLEVTPKENGEFEVKLKVLWSAQTREGEAVTQAYQQQWQVITDENNHLLIQKYLVEAIE